MHNEQTPPGEAADGRETHALGIAEPAGAGKASDGAATGADQGNDTTTSTDTGAPPQTTAEARDDDPVADLYTELTGELDESETATDAKPTQDAQHKPEETPPPADHKPPTSDDDGTPARRHIKNLKKQLDERDAKLKQLGEIDKEHQDVLEAVARLEAGFKRARIDPEQAITELDTLAKAAEGDPEARHIIATRYGITATTSPAPTAAPALTDQQRRLLEEYGLADEWTKAGGQAAAQAAPASGAAATAPTAGTPGTRPAPQAQPGPQALHPERVGTEAMATIAAGVRAAEGEQAQQILDDAGKRMLAKVEAAKKEFGVLPSPDRWASLFRTAVGEATAALRRPRQAPPRGLPPSSGGGTNPPRDALEEVFEGML